MQTLNFLWEHLGLILGLTVVFNFIIYRLEDRVEKLEKLIKEKQNGKEEGS